MDQLIPMFEPQEQKLPKLEGDASSFATGSPSLPPAIYTSQTEQVVILAFMASAIAEQLSVTAPADILLATVIAIALSSILTGVGLFLLGIFGQGNLAGVLIYIPSSSTQDSSWP